MRKNRYGIDDDYFKKKLEIIIRDLEHYRPTELIRELRTLSESVSPIDKCAKCGNRSLVVYDDESNECLRCQNIQNVKGT